MLIIQVPPSEPTEIHGTVAYETWFTEKLFLQLGVEGLGLLRARVFERYGDWLSHKSRKEKQSVLLSEQH